MAVYEAMARMAQDFSMRCLLVEGQGNFGSVDGDPPAAMRYTEARLTAPAMDMLADIRKETVNFSDNFDGSLTEPDVLPATIPNLLVNGATGIAVGMSTNIPPHNLGEVVDALIYMLGNWDRLDDVDIEHLMRFIQGPDFPTGGLIVQTAEDEDLQAAYGTGRGRVTVQARAHIEEISRGRTRILVTELPYMVNKSSLIERIAELARESHIEGIADLRDESDRHGLRIVIELSKTAEPEKVLQDLYKSTQMRTTFGIIMLALVDGEPRMLSLKQALRVYLDHRLEVVRRRIEFDLAKARQRAHILEGLRIALKYLDEVIDLIRKAPDADIARDRLMKRFKLSEIQAMAILDMPLRRLASLERKKIEDEYKELQILIKELEALLKSPIKMRSVVADGLRQVKETYGDRRRTQIARLGAGDKSATSFVLTTSALLPEQEVWVAATAEGLISRTQDEKPPRISGTAAPRCLVQVNTRDTLFLVSERGEAAGIPVHSLPETDNPQEGTPLHKASALAEGDKLAAIFSLPVKEERLAGWFVFTCTRQGLIKKTAIEELPGPTGKSFTIVKVNEDDQLGWVRLTDGKAEILLATADGMAIRFTEDEVRPMGLVAAGVGGIKLGARDEVVGMELIPTKGELLFVASDGKAKRIEPAQFPAQGRYGAGVIAWKLPRTSQVVGLAAGKGNFRVTLLLDKLAPKAIRLDEAPLQARAAAGKSILDLKTGYQVLGLSIPWIPPRPVEGGRQKPVRDFFDEEETTPKKSEAEQLTFGLEETAKPVKADPKQASAARTVSSQVAKAATRRPTVAKTAKSTLTATTPAKRTPAANKPAKSTPVSARPAKNKPAAGKPAKSTPTAKPAINKLATDKPAKSTPAAAKSAKSTPAYAKSAKVLGCCEICEKFTGFRQIYKKHPQKSQHIEHKSHCQEKQHFTHQRHAP
jgi:DNA gyrase subunit A